MATDNGQTRQRLPSSQFSRIDEFCSKIKTPPLKIILKVVFLRLVSIFQLTDNSRKFVELVVVFIAVDAPQNSLMNFVKLRRCPF